MDEPTDDEVLAAWPTAAIDEDNVAHYRGRLQQRLLINRCGSCGHWHHPPRPRCPECWSDQVAATEVSGAGVVELSTVLHVGAPHEDIDYETGYRLVAVRLDDAPEVRFTASLHAWPVERDPTGRRVGLGWARRGGAPLPVFVVGARSTDVEA
jgi:hypothetical protein